MSLLVMTSLVVTVADDALFRAQIGHAAGGHPGQDGRRWRAAAEEAATARWAPAATSRCRSLAGSEEQPEPQFQDTLDYDRQAR